MTDLRTAAQAVIKSYDRTMAWYGGTAVFGYVAHDAMEALRQALAEPVNPDKRIAELERLVQAQQKAFDIESNRITFAQHKSLHKMLICDAIKKLKDCQGHPYSAWDMWLIDAKCMLERVLREWPAPQEVTLAQPPSIDALIAEAIEKHDDEMADIRTVNTRKIAQPYLDALISMIDDLSPSHVNDEYGCSYSEPLIMYHACDIKDILDKYRGQK